MTLDQPLVIPDDFLQALHLTKKDKIKVHLDGQRIIMERDTPLRPKLVQDDDLVASFSSIGRKPTQRP